MLTVYGRFVRLSFGSTFFRVLLPVLLLVAAIPSLSAQPSVEYEVIARSGETAVPGGSGTFSYFDSAPAIDAEGNVVFFGGASAQSGIYTAVGSCCQRVADLTSLAPNGGGQRFNWFSPADGADIDAGRVAFTAQFPHAVTGAGVRGIYSNVGQFGPLDLVEVAAVDGQEWSGLGSPWVDGDVVALRGNRLIPTAHTTVLLWDGWTSSESFVDGGSGSIASNAEAVISGDAVSFQRIASGKVQLAVSGNQGMDVLAAVGSTLVPDGGGATFRLLSNQAVLDRDGQDAAFAGYFLSSPTLVGVYKRTAGGALERVADVVDVVPGADPLPDGTDHLFKDFAPTGIAISNGRVVFLGYGQFGVKGLYTDVDGSLEVLVDTEYNDAIELDGVEERIYALSMGRKAFALTPQGYMVVFRTTLESGDHAIVRATIGAPSSDRFTVYKDYSDNNPDQVSVSLSCSSGTVVSSPLWASEGSPAVFTIQGASAGATCTATETSVASGYTKNESGCLNRALNGSCTIVNTLNTQTNNPPTASFTFSCSGLTCNFNGSGSSDSDGSITGYQWNFGNGSSGSGVTTSRTYGAAGTYTVTLTVTDNQGATGTLQRSVTVSAPTVAITLSVTGYKSKGLQKADLSWSGANGTQVDVYRDGAYITRTANDGFHTDNIDQRGGGSYTYKVCEAGTSTCSSEQTFAF